jgi:hypothetical protein
VLKQDQLQKLQKTNNKGKLFEPHQQEQIQQIVSQQLELEHLQNRNNKEIQHWRGK